MPDHYSDKENNSGKKNENPDNIVGNNPDDLNRPNKNPLQPDWKNVPTLVELRQDLDYARKETTEQTANVEGWLDLRNIQGKEKARGAKKGRSTVQPKLVRKHNEWRYPALTEPFLNTDRMFTVLPRTGEDQQSAKQNQMVLNWQFDTQIDKVSFMDKYVRTAVDEGSVIVRIGWEREYASREREETVYDFFEPVPDDPQSAQQAQIVAQAIQLLQANSPEYERLDEVIQTSAEKSVELQTLVIANPTGTETVIQEEMVRNGPSLKIINIKNIFIDPSCEGNWNEAQYIIHTYEATRSEMEKKKDQFQNLDKVNWEQAKVGLQAGNPDHTTQTPYEDPRASSDKQKVLVYEYWGMWDIRDDKLMVPVVVSWIGDTIIQMEESSFPDGKPPFVIVPYMPITDSVFGEADASLLQDNQRIIGAVMRGMIDLMGRSANAQYGFTKGALDPVNKRRFINGEDFEFNPLGDPRSMIHLLAFPEIPNSAQQTIETQSLEAESLSGIKSFNTGISGDTFGRTATAARGALDAAAIREISILRRLAAGIKKIGEKIISMNAQFLSDKEVIRVTNEEFIEIKREDLEGEFDLKVDISTAAMDDQKATDLGMILQTVGPDMDPGLRQVVLGEIADLKRMPHLADRIRNYQPQPDPIAQKRAELELAKLEAEVQLDTAKAQEALARAGKTGQETQDIATGVAHEREVERHGGQARGNRESEVTKALLDGETPPEMIEAAVGYNRLLEEEDRRRTPRTGTNPIRGI